MDRFITAATAAKLNRRAVEMFSPTHFQSFNPYLKEMTHWYVVPDDDPRVTPMVPIERLVAESDDDRRDQHEAAVARSFEANKR